MDIYSGFAEAYDELMDNIPYDTIVADLLALMETYGVTPEESPVVELGCGTGTITRAVADRGYRIIGVDLSEDMLSEAWAGEMEEVQEIDPDEDEQPECEEFPLHHGHILYLCQDILELDLPGCYPFVFALSDTMNYLTEDGDLEQAFLQIRNVLSEGGRFVFDLKTEKLYAEGMGDRTIVDSREDVTMIWENTYDPEEHINEYALTFFRKREPSELYEKFEEVHYQRAYSKEEVLEAAEKAGLVLEGWFEAYTHQEVTGKTERVYAVLRK
ncbi:MAG: class I SAM-dependent methyltransferase [Lachnospiraceae bacterium]|nr:class I SAM-dependent methyltransferase [Lachnospiraceae bacterium]